MWLKKALTVKQHKKENPVFELADLTALLACLREGFSR